MRFGAFIPMGVSPSSAGASAQALESHGFDSVWLEEGFSSPAWANPLMAVPLVASATKVCRIGVVAVAGLTHPIYLAEEAAAADNACGGRLILALRAARRDEWTRAGVAPNDQASRFGDAVAIVADALRSRPFSAAGKHWTIPGHLEVHPHSGEVDEVILTPPPTQIPLPIWRIARNKARVLGSRSRTVAVLLDVPGSPGAMRDLATALENIDAELVIMRFDHQFFEEQVAEVAAQVIPRLRSVMLPNALEKALDGPVPF